MTQSLSEAPQTIAVEDPASGKIVGHIRQMSADEVARLVERARAAQPEWDQAGFSGRAEVMRALRGWVVDNRVRLLQTVMDEGGRTREDALLGELFYVCDLLGFWAKRAEKYLSGIDVRPHSPFLLGRKFHVRYKPLGVIGVIAPWNYPLGLGFGDSIPALMAGNAVVIKPSSVTPLSTLLIEEGFRAVGGPDGVFSVACGAGSTGGALVDTADMIMFTGSVATGKRIAAQAAHRLIPVSLELGGKDPMLILADADLERASDLAVQFAFWNSGQMCVSIERVYVEAPVYDEFVRRVVEKTRALRQGPPGPAGTVEVGAMALPEQVELVEAQLADAVGKGARILVGGRRPVCAGNFLEPTVLVDVDHQMDVMTEETFGPLLPIMRVADEAEAIRLANSSRYGLNSSVFTNDAERGMRVARQIEAGNTCINDAILSATGMEASFGGIKESGIGVRHGAKGIQKYCSEQTVLETARWARRLDASAFLKWPNAPWKTNLIEHLMVALWGSRHRR